MQLKTTAEERSRWRAESLDLHEIILLDKIDTLIARIAELERELEGFREYDHEGNRIR